MAKTGFLLPFEPEKAFGIDAAEKKTGSAEADPVKNPCEIF